MKVYLCAVVLALAAGLFVIPPADAQNHGEVGVFGEYLRFGSTASAMVIGSGPTSFGGLGARLALGSKRIQWEGEVGYDFTRTFAEGFTSPTNGTVSISQSNVRILHGMFGPKLQVGGPVKVFATIKGGAMNFSFSTAPATFAAFTSSVSGLRANNVDAVLYWGGGAEAYLGPIGLRLDVGDEIFFDAAHHNLRITFGPHLRF